MSDKYIEKSFLYLLVLSLLLHLGVAALLVYLPEPKAPPPKEPVFVDLQNIPELKQPATQQETQRLSDQRVRVEREAAPRGTETRDSAPKGPAGQASTRVGPSAPSSAEPGTAPLQPGSSVASLLKPKRQTPQKQGGQQLFPGADRLARLEDSYRRKFESEVAEGETRFLNTDDIQFGSFLRRFENSVYGVWRYPQEAANRGIEGITPVKITFNRRGEIVNVELLESSGAKILDDEVFRTLRLIGPVGGFPKGYDKDEFHLIAFFQYGITRRALR